MPLPAPSRRLPNRLWQGLTSFLFKSRGNGVTLQLFLLVVLPLTALLFAVTFGSTALHNQAMRALVGDRDLRTVRAAASSLGQAFFHQKASIQMLAEAIHPGNDFLAAVQGEPAASSNFDEGVGLFSPEGQLIAANKDLSVWLDRISGNQSPWPGFLQKSQSQAGFSPVIPGDENQPIILLVAARAADGNLVAGAFRPDVLVQSTLKDMLGSGPMSAWVATPQGQLIY
ncbi:MAG TPA: hypothetical protein VF813_06705, partial [Anaerolineaceae bacterium]